MQLKTLISHLPDARVTGPLDREVSSIVYDSRKAKKGSLFVALRGEKTDGAAFINLALEQGATAILGERALENARGTSIVVPNARAALADLANVFFEKPSQFLKMTGVTGTNGKTTFTF